MPEEPLDIQVLNTGELEAELRRVQLGGTVGDFRLAAALQTYALEVAIANRRQKVIVSENDQPLVPR